jgi:hypothetical protein
LIDQWERPSSAVRIPGQRGRHAVTLDERVEEVRVLAREGRLATTFAEAPVERRRQLSGATMAVAGPVVFTKLTRLLEINRGHAACAIAMNRLADTCLDHFYDDLEAVTDDVLRNATRPVHNLEAWMAGRLRAATIDAHRRRRGARGALQRPRLPAWLDKGLEHDPWLGQLAVEILTWVGVSAAAGSGLWPVDGWSERRAAFLGTRTGDHLRAVERDIEKVLSVMRTRPDWYENYVERPLGAKTPPVATAAGDGAAGPPPLVLVEPDELLDARLTALAAVALQTIQRQLRSGMDLGAAVVDVLARVFGPWDPAYEVGDLPHAATTVDERVTALIGDPVKLAQVVRTVEEIVEATNHVIGPSHAGHRGLE